MEVLEPAHSFAIEDLKDHRPQPWTETDEAAAKVDRAELAAGDTVSLDEAMRLIA